MKKIFITIFLPFLVLNLNAQTIIKLPGVYSIMFKNYPYTNTQISFSMPYPFKEYQKSRIDSTNTHQYLMKLPLVSDSLLSACINHVMNSLSFELAYKNHSHGTEIWYGQITNKLNINPSMIGIYFKTNFDSTNIYILTAYALDYVEKKRKQNTSKYVGETIKIILDKYLSRK